MKLYELRKGQAFRFPATEDEPAIEAVSAGVDGAYGRFVSRENGQFWHEPQFWFYCRPTAEVEAIEGEGE